MLHWSFQRFKKVFVQKASGIYISPFIFLLRMCLVQSVIFFLGFIFFFIFFILYFTYYITLSLSCSYKFKSFSYLYDEEQFIASLANDVIILKSLPENLKAARKKNEFPVFKPKSYASPKYYIGEILPKLKKAKVIGLVVSDGGCLQVS